MVDEALWIDRETETTLWYDTIQKEMKKNAVAFQFLSQGKSIPIGYTKISLHMVFDVCMDFTHKA